MTPQLQQAIRLLQMNTIELTEELIQAHESNPLLELEEPAEPAEVSHPDEAQDAESSDSSRDSMDEDWVSAQTYEKVSRNTAIGGNDYEIPDRAGPATLRQSLEEQLLPRGLPAEQYLAAELIIQYLDDAGYLGVSLDEILVELTQAVSKLTERADQDGAVPEHVAETIDLETVESALKVVQSFEPTGVGARSPQECLSLQLAAMNRDTPGLQMASRIVELYLELLGKRDYQTLRRKLGGSEEALREAIELIKHLNPHPGYSVGDVSVNYVVPDVVVELRRGVWMARLNRGSLPNVVINQDYQQLVTDNSSCASFSQMKEQLQDAKWLLANIEKRHSTILAVASQIVERQQAFFEEGPSAMKPMILRDVSEALDIHESTVSRATNGKYMLTPLGVYELRYFFSTEMHTDSGDQTSAVAIQTLIREMIEQEPPRKPISDMKICDALNERGLQVARRTVAKYREQMNIPPSSKRKSL